MSKFFEVSVDVSELAGLQRGLGQLSGESLAATAAAAVNVVVDRFDTKQRAAQVADIALDPGYVARKTKVWPATPADPKATITTSGDLTIMGRYPITSLRDPSRLDRRGNRLGERQAGVLAGIKRSAPANEPQWFMMRLKNDNGTGVFVRTSQGRKKHLYGPSPYSLFRHQINVGAPALLDDLQNTGVDALADAINEALP